MFFEKSLENSFKKYITKNLHRLYLEKKQGRGIETFEK